MMPGWWVWLVAALLYGGGCVQQSGVRVGDDPGHRRVVAE